MLSFSPSAPIWKHHSLELCSTRRKKFDVSDYSIANEVPRSNYKKNKNKGKQHHPTNVTPNSTQISIVQRKPDLRTQLSYARNGHAVMRQWLDAEFLRKLEPRVRNHCRYQELTAWQQKVSVIIAAEDENVKQSCRTVKQCQERLRQFFGRDLPVPFLQYFNTWRSIPAVLAMAEQLAESAAILMDCRSVRLYQDAVFWKRRGDNPTPWHADARMAPFDTNAMITFWIPLHDIQTESSSGLTYCSKSQADFALAYWHENVSEVALEERYDDPESYVHYMPMNIGDVAFHAGWTLHCADPGWEDRLALAISFVDARAPVRISNKAYREDAWSYQDWITQVPTDTKEWEHPLVPILW